MPWKCSVPFTNPLLPAWRVFAMMVLAYGPPDAFTNVRSLLLAITTTDFISALVVTNTSQVSPGLNIQSSNKNQRHCSRCGRDRQSFQHYKIFKTTSTLTISNVEKMCGDVGTEPSFPRRCSRQIHQSNIPASSPSEYYCHSLSIPLVDHLLSKMHCFLQSLYSTSAFVMYLSQCSMTKHCPGVRYYSSLTRWR